MLPSLHPIHAGFQIIPQIHLQHDGLDQHLRELDVHVLDDLFDGGQIAGAAHHDDGVGALVGQDLDVVLAELPEFAGTGIAARSGRRSAAGARGDRLGQRGAAGRRVGGALGRPGRRGVVLFGRGVADQIVQHGGDLFGIGEFQALHLNLDIRRGFDIQHADDALEEVHVLLAGDDDELVGALIRNDLHFAADHAAVGVAHQRLEDLVGRGGGRLLRGGRSQARESRRQRPAGERRGGPGKPRRARGVGFDLLFGLVLFLRLRDDLFQALLDVVRLGKADHAHVDLFRGHQRLIDKLDDLDHAVYVFLRVGDQQAVGALEGLDHPVGALEPLDGLLRLADRDGLELNHLADHLALFRVAAFGRVHLDADAVGPDRLER